jgi:hypothetical protein
VGRLLEISKERFFFICANLRKSASSKSGCGASVPHAPLTRTGKSGKLSPTVEARFTPLSNPVSLSFNRISKQSGAWCAFLLCVGVYRGWTHAVFDAVEGGINA